MSVLLFIPFWNVWVVELCHSSSRPLSVHDKNQEQQWTVATAVCDPAEYVKKLQTGIPVSAWVKKKKASCCVYAANQSKCPSVNEWDTLFIQPAVKKKLTFMHAQDITGCSDCDSVKWIIFCDKHKNNKIALL